MEEMTEKMGIVESAILQLEKREGTGSITLRSLGRCPQGEDRISLRPDISASSR
jgi:hypothetical protein